MLRVALIHDYLNQYGGAERVLEALLNLFPEADIYTLLHSSEATGRRFTDRVVGTSILDLPLVRRWHRPFIPLMPLATETLRLKKRYDLVISETAGYAKGVRVPASTFHLCYCHTPLRYAWETRSYFTSRLFALAAAPAFSYLRWWDARTAQRPDVMLANSRFIADKIARYYGRSAPVLHPPVDHRVFYPDPGGSERSYYLAAGRLLHYKRFDLLLDAFKQLDRRLIIVGSGPEAEKIKSQIANSKNIELIPFVPESQLRQLYSEAQAFIFPQEEDFGLVGAEAISCGAPVIAYASGGAREIVREGENGIFFDRQTPEAIMDAIARFEQLRFDRSSVAASSDRFSVERFTRELVSYLPEALRPV